MFELAEIFGRAMEYVCVVFILLSVKCAEPWPTYCTSEANQTRLEACEKLIGL